MLASTQKWYCLTRHRHIGYIFRPGHLCHIYVRRRLQIRQLRPHQLSQGHRGVSVQATVLQAQFFHRNVELAACERFRFRIQKSVREDACPRDESSPSIK